MGHIDHINGDRGDNRISNLRVVTSTENNRNKAINKNNTSGVTGVTWSKSRRKWIAQIHIGKIGKALGGFDRVEDAIAARKNAETRYGFHENHGRKP